MSDADSLKPDDDALLKCVFCQRLALDAVLLPCIHTSCKQCYHAGHEGEHLSAVATHVADLSESNGDNSSKFDGDSVDHTFNKNSEVSSASSCDNRTCGSDGDQGKRLLDAVTATDVHNGVTSESASHKEQRVALSNRSAPAAEVADATSSADMLTGAGETSIRVCPRCHEPVSMQSDDHTIKTVKTNRHVSRKVQALSKNQETMPCSFCSEAVVNEVAAEHRCIDCSKFLCETCRTFHARLMKQHRVLTLAEDSNTKDSNLETDVAEVVECPQHGRELSFSCTSCNDFKCVTCVADCDSAGHKYMTLSVSARKAREHILLAIPDVEEKLSRLRAAEAGHQQHVSNLECMRTALTESLQKSKRTLLEMTTNAYDDAKSGLDDHVDEALISAEAVGRKTSNLKRDLEHVLLYVRSLLSASDPLSLVDQFEQLSVRICTLGQRATVLPCAKDTRLEIVSSTQPNLSGNVAKFLGNVKVTSDHSLALESTPQPNNLVGGENENDEHELKLSTPFTFTKADGAVVSVVLHRKVCYKVDARCLDIAVCTDGGAFLVSEHGIRAYDVSGRQQSVAKPDCEYGSIAAHCKERFAAWNYTKQKVEIFTRDGHIFESMKALGRVAIDEDGKMAAANSGGVTLFAGDGQQILHVDYSGHNDSSKWLPAVALRHRTLILALQPTTAHGGSSVVAFDYQGRQKWRCNFDEPIYGLCCDSWGNVYVAFHDSNVVRVLSSEGKPLANVLTSAHGLSKPWRVSVSSDSRWLAVLSADKLTVTVYAALTHLT